MEFELSYGSVYNMPAAPTKVDDKYDGDVTHTYKLEAGRFSLTSTPPAIRTTRSIVGSESVDVHYTYHDYASVFGQNNVNNVLSLTVSVNFKDTIGPEIFCRSDAALALGNPKRCSLPAGS